MFHLNKPHMFFHISLEFLFHNFNMVA
jgi:hypothetical protein